MDSDFDVESELWEQAEYPRPKHMKLDHEPVDRTTSLSDFYVDKMEYEHKPEHKFVRGRRLKIYDRDEKPGGLYAHTTKQIREVSGLGYSNELIEKSIQNYAKLNEEKPITKYPNMPNLTFRPCTSSASSSSNSKKSKKSDNNQ